MVRSPLGEEANIRSTTDSHVDLAFAQRGVRHLYLTGHNCFCCTKPTGICAPAEEVDGALLTGDNRLATAAADAIQVLAV